LGYTYEPTDEHRAVLDKAVRSLLATQTPDGYIGTYQPSVQMGGWDIWGRKYVLLGLLAYYDATGDRAALEAASQGGFPVSAGVSLLLSAGLAKLSALTAGGDTGLMHLATAMGKRVVAIIQSTNQYPFQHPEWAVTPSGGVDLSTLGTETVIAACERALAETGVGGAPQSR